MLDINDPDQKNYIQDVLRQGAKTEFWQLIKQRLQLHITGVQNTLDSDAFENLIAEEYKIRTETLKKEKNNMLGMMDLPEKMVNELEKPEFFNQDKEADVYPQAEDFEPKNT